MSIIQWKLAYICLLISIEMGVIASNAISTSMVILLNLMQLDESIFLVDVLKLLKNAGWNPSF